MASKGRIFMSLFDDVIVNAAAAVDTFGKVAGDVVDRSRARVSSAELKGKINKQFETLGRYIYDTSVSGTTDQSVVDEYVSNISVLIGELKSLQDTLTADLGRIICPKCCTKNSVDSLFCKKCGEIIESVSVHDFKTCSCGACSVDGGHQYLRRCAISMDDFIELSEFQNEQNEKE